MQEAYIELNPLIRSVVNASFNRATQSIGLPEFPQQVFFQEIGPYLRSSDSIFQEGEKPKLWKAILHGDIVATEVWENKRAFYVRGVVGSRVIDIRLTHDNHSWHVQSVLSMYYRPVYRSPWFHRCIVIGAVAIAAVVGYTLHHQSPTGRSLEAVHSAAVGSVSAPKTTSSASVASSNAASTGAQTRPADSGSRATTPQVHTLSFALKPGMSLHELSRFLHAHHLVNDAVKFDMVMKRTHVDRHLRPGVFHFQTGMTQSQIIQVLKDGPTKH